MFLYVVEEKFVAALSVAALTAINRETGAFGAVLYACIAFGRQPFPSIAVRSVILTFLPYLLAISVRKYVLGDHLALGSSGQWYAGLSYNLALLEDAFYRPSPVGWPSLLFATLVLPWLVFLNRDSSAGFKLRVVLSFLGVFAITAAVGVSAEVRTFIPCVALLFACAVAMPVFCDSLQHYRAGTVQSLGWQRSRPERS
jgi:hypothetical protein